MNKKERGDINVEYVYRNVMNEIDRAIADHDVDRAQAMAKRASTGHPKVLPKLDVIGDESLKEVVLER